MDYCLTTFRSVHEALHFEKILKEIGLNLELIPVPREISTSCGLAARFSPEDRPRLEKAIAAYHLEIGKIYVLTEKS